MPPTDQSAPTFRTTLPRSALGFSRVRSFLSGLWQCYTRSSPRGSRREHTITIYTRAPAWCEAREARRAAGGSPNTGQPPVSPKVYDRVVYPFCCATRYGRRFEVIPGLARYVPPERDPFSRPVEPGATLEGRAIFAVTPKASGFRLQFGDGRPFPPENGYVDLGS